MPINKPSWCFVYYVNRRRCPCRAFCCTIEHFPCHSPKHPHSLLSYRIYQTIMDRRVSFEPSSGANPTVCNVYHLNCVTSHSPFVTLSRCTIIGTYNLLRLGDFKRGRLRFLSFTMGFHSTVSISVFGASFRIVPVEMKIHFKCV